jgi:hypothetical protein
MGKERSVACGTPSGGLRNLQLGGYASTKDYSQHKDIRRLLTAKDEGQRRGSLQLQYAQ